MLTTDNSRCLDQAKELLKSCPPDLYCQKTANCFNSSIGEHLRHILDHYSCFFRDLPDTRINYDLRERNPLLETSKTAAEKKLTAIQKKLTAMDMAMTDRLEINMDTGGEAFWTPSSPFRELQYLLSHTIHHYALIGTICSSLQLTLPKDFGIAPSTLRYRRHNK